MDKPRCQKTMKYKGNLTQNCFSHKNDKNALTTFLHSTDDLLTYRENRGKEKRKMERKRRKMQKGKVENWKWKELKVKKWGDFLSFFFVSLLLFRFCLVFTFQNHWICFGSTKMGIFYREKAFNARKNEENDFSPLRKIFLLRPCLALIGGPGFHSWVLALRSMSLPPSNS